MVRGIGRRAIFRDDLDRTDFLTCLTALPKAQTLTVYAWALLPIHLHLLVRTPRRPLARLWTRYWRATPAPSMPQGA